MAMTGTTANALRKKTTNPEVTPADTARHFCGGNGHFCLQRPRVAGDIARRRVTRPDAPLCYPSVTQGGSAMARKLSAVGIEKLKPGAQRREIPDAAPGLYLVLQPTGRRRFAVRTRVNGRSVKITLPTGTTLHEARKAASEIMHEVARGIDPVATRAAAKRERSDAAAKTLR